MEHLQKFWPSNFLLLSMTILHHIFKQNHVSIDDDPTLNNILKKYLEICETLIDLHNESPKYCNKNTAQSFFEMLSFRVQTNYTE